MRAHMLILLSSLPLTLPGPVDLSRTQFVKELEAAHSQVTEFQFRFQGSQRWPREKEQRGLGLGPDGIRTTFSGTYSSRLDLAIRVVSTLSDRSAGQSWSSVTVAQGDKTRVGIRRLDAENEAVILREGVIDEWAYETGNFSRILVRDRILTWARGNSWDYEFHGVEPIDGHECLVVTFKDANVQPGPDIYPRSWKCWVDMERGGHVLRLVEHWGDRRVSIVDGIRLEKFEAPSQRAFRLPVSGRVESYVTYDPTIRGPAVTDEPIYVETYTIVNGTMKLEQGLNDDALSIDP